MPRLLNSSHKQHIHSHGGKNNLFSSITMLTFYFWHSKRNNSGRRSSYQIRASIVEHMMPVTREWFRSQFFWTIFRNDTGSSLTPLPHHSPPCPGGASLWEGSSKWGEKICPQNASRTKIEKRFDEKNLFAKSSGPYINYTHPLAQAHHLYIYI